MEIQELLEFVAFINQFRSVERVMWFRGVEGRERDGEHCFQVALVAWFVNDRLGLKLNVERIISYALTHDLVEAYADDADWSGHSTAPMEGKKEREALALERIKREWGGNFPAMIEAIEKYEKQADEESRFVYGIDKLVTELNIAQDEPGRVNTFCKVTREASHSYKAPRVARHPVTLELYRKLTERMGSEYYYTPA